MMEHLRGPALLITVSVLVIAVRDALRAQRRPRRQPVAAGLPHELHPGSLAGLPSVSPRRVATRSAGLRWLPGAGRRRRRAELAALIDVCEQLAIALAAEGTLRAALMAVPSPTCERLRHSLESGRTVGDAVQHLVDEAPRERRMVAAVLEAVADGGADGVRALDRCASVLRSRTELDDELVSASAQARMSALMMTLLPVAGVAALGAIEPGTLAFLFTTSTGVVLAAGATAWNACGWLWMRSMIAGAGR